MMIKNVLKNTYTYCLKCVLRLWTIKTLSIGKGNHIHYTDFLIKTKEHLVDGSEYDLESINYEVIFLWLSG